MPVMALLEDDKLCEYQEGAEASSRQIGDIVLGSIRRIDVKIKAGFVDVGDPLDAFLPLDDKDLDSYRAGQELVLQIKRLSEGHKGAMVSDEFSLRGPHVVLSFGNEIRGVSKKITDEAERKRLRKAALTFPSCDNVGYVVRTEAEEQTQDVLCREALYLYDRFRDIMDKHRFSMIGTTLYREDSFWEKMILSRPLSQVDEIICEGSTIFDEVSSALMIYDLAEGEDPACKLRKYSDASMTLADLYKIPSQLSRAFEKTVFLDGSGYLYIEKTAALTAIDVNSGQDKGTEDKESYVTNFNLSVIPEIVRQIRLRDLTGVIMIDFINMTNEKDQKTVTDAFRLEMEKDRRTHHVYGLTNLQLMELNRSKG